MDFDVWQYLVVYYGTAFIKVIKKAQKLNLLIYSINLLEISSVQTKNVTQQFMIPTNYVIECTVFYETKIIIKIFYIDDHIFISSFFEIYSLSLFWPLSFANINTPTK